VIREFLQHHKYCEGIQAEPIIEALTILMTTNVFRLDDTYWLQKTGTGMGQPPACAYATIYQAIHEDRLIPKYEQQLRFYGRLIDDVFGMWIGDHDTNQDEIQWRQFQKDMKFGILEWKFSERKKRINFLDLWLWIDNGIVTDIYEKEHNLYQYLPPHSCHAPGIAKGLIYGMINRAFDLISESTRRDEYIKKFFDRMNARGWSPKYLQPVFQDAIKKAIRKTLTSEGLQKADKANFEKILNKYCQDPTVEQAFQEYKYKNPELLYMNFDNDNDNLNNTVFYHIPYHPRNPSSTVIQRIFRETMIRPLQNPKDPNSRKEPVLSSLINYNKCEIGIERLIVANHKQKNLRELLFRRKFKTEEGKQASRHGDKNQVTNEPLPTFKRHVIRLDE
jgi:hypothetical protein